MVKPKKKLPRNFWESEEGVRLLESKDTNAQLAAHVRAKYGTDTSQLAVRKARNRHTQKVGSAPQKPAGTFVREIPAGYGRALTAERLIQSALEILGRDEADSLAFELYEQAVRRRIENAEAGRQAAIQRVRELDRSVSSLETMIPERNPSVRSAMAVSGE